MFKNLFEKDKRSTIVYAQEKKVDKDFNIDPRDALCPKNCSFQFRSDKVIGLPKWLPKVALLND